MTKTAMTKAFKLDKKGKLKKSTKKFSLIEWFSLSSNIYQR